MVDVYLDTHTGQFSAEFNGIQFSDVTLDAIRQKLSNASSSDLDCVWEPCIKYGIVTRSDAAKTCYEKSEISVWYHIVLLSQQINGNRYMRDAVVCEDGSVVPGESDAISRAFDGKDNVIPFSPDGFSYLRDICAAVRDAGKSISDKLASMSGSSARLLTKNDSY